MKKKTTDFADATAVDLWADDVFSLDLVLSNGKKLRECTREEIIAEAKLCRERQQSYFQQSQKFMQSAESEQLKLKFLEAISGGNAG
jgi:hypothetical protein